jgi:hypothetical protein
VSLLNLWISTDFGERGSDPFTVERAVRFR